MSVAIIGTVGVPACYGGFETLVENLVEAEGDFTVYCSSKSYERRVSEYKSAELIYVPMNANGVSSPLYDGLSMLHALITGSKVFLVLGVSAGLLLPAIRLVTRRKLVTNIDGLEWRRNKWGRLAKGFLKLSERAAVRASHIVIADNQGIADYVAQEYGVAASVIAYGGDHVLTRPLTRTFDGYALGLCRIEPENNVHVILDAFSKSDKKLKFLGNWDASEYGRKLKSQYADVNNIQLMDPVYDLETLFELRDCCDFYVHGHSAGGTNPSLVEAMFFGKPIIAYDCIYNRATLENKGVYFEGAPDLLTAIEKMTSFGADEELIAIAQKKYTWSAIRESYLNLLNIK